jgi:hypothetical protein
MLMWYCEGLASHILIVDGGLGQDIRLVEPKTLPELTFLRENEDKKFCK